LWRKLILLPIIFTAKNFQQKIRALSAVCKETMHLAGTTVALNQEQKKA